MMMTCFKIKPSFFPSRVAHLSSGKYRKPVNTPLLRNWTLNVLLAGMFSPVIACMQHWVINLQCILKCCNSGILLFAACPLFISCISCVWQNGGQQTCAVFRKALRQKRWCIRGLKWTMICDIVRVNQSQGKSHFSEEKNLTAGDKDVETISTHRNQQCITKPSAVLCQK